MILGFTGTRDGMTEAQKQAITLYLRDRHITAHYNGACHGADQDMFWLMMNYSIALNDSVVMELCPGDTEQYAWCITTRSLIEEKTGFNGTINIHKPQVYQLRNRVIVSRSDHLLAAPGSDHETLRSGTWATVRIARRQKVGRTIAWPDGRLEDE
jgi:hypothetical protein